MTYMMISADDHIDLGYLPSDLWTERLPTALRERAPHVEDRGEKGEYWVCDGETWADYRGERWFARTESHQTRSRPRRRRRSAPSDDDRQAAHRYGSRRRRGVADVSTDHRHASRRA